MRKRAKCALGVAPIMRGVCPGRCRTDGLITQLVKRRVMQEFMLCLSLSGNEYLRFEAWN